MSVIASEGSEEKEKNRVAKKEGKVSPHKSWGIFAINFLHRQKTRLDRDLLLGSLFPFLTLSREITAFRSSSENSV